MIFFYLLIQEIMIIGNIYLIVIVILVSVLVDVLNLNDKRIVKNKIEIFGEEGFVQIIRDLNHIDKINNGCDFVKGFLIDWFLNVQDFIFLLIFNLLFEFLDKSV